MILLWLRNVQQPLYSLILHLQLKAVVTQEGEKTLFALPTKQGDIDPNTMSTLSLTLRPIPIEVKPASSKKPVEAIEGIGPVIGERLRAYRHRNRKRFSRGIN